MTSSRKSKLSVCPGFGKLLVVLSIQIFCGPGSICLGCAVCKKYSKRVGQPLFPGISPDVAQTKRPTTEVGFRNCSCGFPASKCSIKSCQIGAAPVIPETRPFICVLSLLPTHT